MYERVYHLADIRRGASLRDLRVQVHVAHTKSRVKARYCVEMQNYQNGSKWVFGATIADLKSFDDELKRLVKKQVRSMSSRAMHLFTKKGVQASSTDVMLSRCFMCKSLLSEIKKWEKITSLSVFGKRHLDKKCHFITEYFYKIFRLFYYYAEWLDKCETLREILRMTERFCHIEYADDRVAIRMIKSMKRSISASSENLECIICLGEICAHTCVELACGHQFHDVCVCMWFHTKLNCPVCRCEHIYE
jgi:hypothetical protein